MNVRHRAVVRYDPRTTMATRIVILLVGSLLAGTDAHAQSAGEALRADPVPRGIGGHRGTDREFELGAVRAAARRNDHVPDRIVGRRASRGSSIENLQVPIRRSQSFGPMFAERPFTTGKGRLNAGVVFQHTSFASVGGQSLNELEGSVSYRFGDEVYRFNSSLDVAIDRTIISGTYGVHDRIDVGVIVPVGRARVSGFSSSYQLSIGGVETDRTDSNGSSFGLGDVVVRAKTALFASDRFDAAATVDFRLPTGDPEKLLGTGYTQTKVLFVGGSTLGALAPHVNVGYTFGGSGMQFGEDNRWEGSFGDPELIVRQPSEEVNYTIGIDMSATQRITIAGDIIGRVVKDSASMSLFDSGAV